ncbi:MAG: sensor domain-containing diguanylate cyclase [Ilumatobacteraceae bacterium]
MTATVHPDAVDTAPARRSTEIELFSLAGNDGRLREVNAAFVHLLGLRQDEVEGRSLLELVAPDDVPQVVAALAALAAGTPEVLLETRFPRPGLAPVYLEWVARPMPGTDQWWAAGRDTSAFHTAVEKTLDLRARLDLAVGDAGAGMWDLDLSSDRFVWEPEACQVLGVSAAKAPSTPAELVQLAHLDDRAPVAAAFAALLHDGTACSVVMRIGEGPAMRYLALRGKALTRDRRGKPKLAVGILLDVTAEKAMEEQMLRMVMTDALTGIPNRRALDQDLRVQMRRCTREQLPLSVLMVDIDNFKRFNDTYGHLVGDDALCAVARALAGQTAIGTLLGRFGGEEFAVVLPLIDAAGAAAIANGLVDAVARITLHQAPDSQLTISVGAATWSPHDDLLKAAELLDRADQALYTAKAHGKNRAVSYEPVAPAV